MQDIGEPIDERLFRANQREVDSLARCEFGDGIEVGRAGIDWAGQPEDSGVHGRGIELSSAVKSLERPYQCVLAPTAANDKYSQKALTVLPIEGAGG